MENDYLGPRRIETLKKEDFDWQKKAQEAVLNIQEFTVKYFEITAKAQKGISFIISPVGDRSTGQYRKKCTRAASDSGPLLTLV